MVTSETTAAVLPALFKIQQGVEALQKTASNPHFGSKYTPLPVIWKALLPVLKEHGCVITQSFEPVNMVEQGKVLAMTTTLVHAKSGEWVASTGTMPLDKADPQGFGRAVTYFSRYSIVALLGLATEVDDDAEGAMDRRAKPPKASAEGGDDIEDLL